MAGATAALLIGVPVGWTLFSSARFPTSKTPEGAYVRIAIAFGRGKLQGSFPYLESAAQNAICTIHEFRNKSLARIRSSFEDPERSKWEASYRTIGDATDPAAAWVIMATERGWDARMRRDLSGIGSVESAGDRATIETVRGTRYPFRRDDRGRWGLSLFTAELVAEKERAARDFDMIDRAARDYENARG
ncbi:MAG: hypothetical protein MUF54_08635, partial [Polyangiaceae bacterium]|nr:hypothetical protein [Polyangiaceae bacterium]